MRWCCRLQCQRLIPGVHSAFVACVAARPISLGHIKQMAVAASDAGNFFPVTFPLPSSVHHSAAITQTPKPYDAAVKLLQTAVAASDTGHYFPMISLLAPPLQHCGCL